jgi:hypothetical protein
MTGKRFVGCDRLTGGFWTPGRCAAGGKKSERKVPTGKKQLPEFFLLGNKKVSLIKWCSPLGFGLKVRNWWGPAEFGVPIQNSPGSRQPAHQELFSQLRCGVENAKKRIKLRWHFSCSVSCAHLLSPFEMLQGVWCHGEPF